MLVYSYGMLVSRSQTTFFFWVGGRSGTMTIEILQGVDWRSHKLLTASSAHVVFNNNLATRKILFIWTVFYFRSNSAHNKKLGIFVTAFRSLKTNVTCASLGTVTGPRSVGLHQSTFTEDRCVRIFIVIVPDPFFPPPTQKKTVVWPTEYSKLTHGQNDIWVLTRSIVL